MLARLSIGIEYPMKKSTVNDRFWPVAVIGSFRPFSDGRSSTMCSFDMELTGTAPFHRAPSSDRSERG